jgi:hypothetical protein
LKPQAAKTPKYDNADKAADEGRDEQTSGEQGLKVKVADVSLSQN